MAGTGKDKGMRKGVNPVSIIVMILFVIGAFVLAAIVKHFIPEEASNWSGLIFWGIVVLVSGIGAFISGKYLNSRR